MITVQKAKQKILKEARILPATRLSLTQSLHRILANTIKAPISLPIEANSAMDGYALRWQDTQSASFSTPVSLQIIGTHRAGGTFSKTLRPHQAIKIMTGATLPKGANAIEVQERVEYLGNKIILISPVSAGANIRKRGEEIQKGKIVLKSGTKLSSRHIGLLANLGLKSIPVFQKPRVALVMTGSELVAPGNKLKSGKIYDSNSPMLEAALREKYLEPCLVKRVPDEKAKIHNALKQALKKADVVITAGGVSVGEFDYSKAILAKLGVKEIFWKVAQKPGKPLFFGNKGRKLVFGLPGNPVSVWVCFYEYVLPALMSMQGIKPENLQNEMVAELVNSVKPTKGKTVFARGMVSFQNGKWQVASAKHQGSHMLKGLAEANCLMEIPPGSKPLEKGALIKVHRLE